MQLPYLSGPLREAFDRWSDATLARHVPPLTFTELRKGVQALVQLYSIRPASQARRERAHEGASKRAAQATYFAQLHFLAVHHALVMLDGAETFGRVDRVVDLGCGTGGAGAAAALTLPGQPLVEGIDRSGWALEAARATWSDLGLTGRARRATLPRALARQEPGTLICLAWVLDELQRSERDALLRTVRASLHRGAGLAVVEPAGRPPGWWGAWADALAPLGVRDELIRVSIERPRLVRELDRAARLDHQVIGARLLIGRKRAAAADDGAAAE
jgi:SAM-dependent methyltransferase